MSDVRTNTRTQKHIYAEPRANGVCIVSETASKQRVKYT